jgi:serine/threonine-protein kinase
MTDPSGQHFGDGADQDTVLRAPTPHGGDDPEATEHYPDRRPPGRGTPPPEVPGYEILGELGRGGMGVVYKAQQARPRRLVALKMILSSVGEGAGLELVARFRAEADAAARLRHAHIVPIFEYGEHAGQPLYSMEFVEGGGLDKKLAAGPLAPRDAAALVETLARAVHYAHEQGVLHRDLKPANVLLDADGQPKVSDFGLAKEFEGSGTSTASGIFGTPAYMAPEQAGSAPLGPAVDVYGLGAVLYEALTGRAPFHGSSKWETLAKVCTQPPEAPRRLRPDAPADLEAVCLNCLEKAPGRRYPTAAALADDLRRFLDGESTRARPSRWPARAWRAVRRRPALNLLRVAAAALLIAAVTWGAVAYFTNPERAREENERELDAGRPVTFIGETGEPKWSVVYGDAAAVIGTDPDGAFTVVSPLGVALVEMAPNPRQKSFRFHAEVRHIDAGELGTVGVYVGHSRKTTDVGPHDFVTALTFADRGILPPRQLFVQLQGCCQAPAATWNVVELLPVDKAAPLPPIPLGANGWRPLTIDVTPEQITIRSGETDLGTVSHAHMAVAAGRATSGRAGFGGFTLAVAPGGGLGLYIYHGTASFRRVGIEPLP